MKNYSDDIAIYNDKIHIVPLLITKLTLISTQLNRPRIRATYRIIKTYPALSLPTSPNILEPISSPKLQ